MTLLAGRSITRSFGSRLILDGTDRSVEPEARIGVVWPYGSGRSTLPKILAGREDPDGGEVSRRRGARVGHLDRIADRIADCTVEIDGGVRATDGGYSAWLAHKTAATG